MKCYDNDLDCQLESPAKKQTTKTKSSKISDHFNHDSDNQDHISNALKQNKSIIQLERYFKTKFSKEGVNDLLKFRFKYSNEFPILFRIAKKLSVPFDRISIREEL